ncbi:MAG: VOC family protein [Dehalococcoidia bacterium]|nr:VOC family protein [Dehalococcoidia bacterium]
MSVPPNGMPVFYPFLGYADAYTAIDWLERVFGFRRLLVAPGEDGTVVHAELAFGPGVFMCGTRSAEELAKTVQRAPYAYVADPRAHYERVKAAGATITRDYEEKDYGGAAYSVLDCEDNEWHFGSYVPSPAYPVYAATAYLAVHDAAAAIDFYSRAFGAAERGERYVGEDGRVGHAEVAIGPVTIYLSDEHPELEVVGPRTLGGRSSSIVLHVADTDASFDSAVAAGATPEREPADQPYGRMASVVDPFGHRWMLHGEAGS